MIYILLETPFIEVLAPFVEPDVFRDSRTQAFHGFGFVCPLLRMLIFGMPAFPMSLYMAFELCAYGVMAGLLYRLLPKKVPYLYINLVISMIVGRIVYCIVFAAFSGNVAGIPAFFALFGSQFVNTWAGIVIHLVLIPPIVLALKKAGLTANE